MIFQLLSVVQWPMTGCVGGPSPIFSEKIILSPQLKSNPAFSQHCQVMNVEIKSYHLMNFTDFLLFSFLFSISLKSTALPSHHQLLPVLILKFSLFAVLLLWAEGKSRPGNLEKVAGRKEGLSSKAKLFKAQNHIQDQMSMQNVSYLCPLPLKYGRRSL